MPNFRSPSNNRLLALEQELLEKKRLAQVHQNRRNIPYIQKKETRTAIQKRHTNNRLLQLERELLKDDRQFENDRLISTVSHSETPATSQFLSNGDRLLSRSHNRLLALEQELLEKQNKPTQRKPKKRKPKSKRSRVQSQIFDTGEAIELQYNSAVFPVATPQTIAVSLPEEVENVEELQIQASELELSVTPEKVISQSEIVETIRPETENKLAQTSEFLSEIEPKSNFLQEDDIRTIIAELNIDRQEDPTPLVFPQEESRNDRNNPHAIFDRMGKNMAYATTFDLGTIELEQLFDEFDRTLDRKEKVDGGVSISPEQGKVELEQRFDEFDRTLELEEKVDRGEFISPEQGKVELEQRFDEFDRALEQQEREKTDPEPISQNNSPSAILSEKTDTEKETTETANMTSDLVTEAMPNQNQQPLIIPLEFQQPTWVQSLSYLTKIDLKKITKIDFNLEDSIFQASINIILFILGFLNFLSQNKIRFKPNIYLQSTPYSFLFFNRGNNEELNPNFKIIDLTQSDLTDGISPLILSNRRSNSVFLSTPVDALTPSRDSPIGTFESEFTKPNSDDLKDFSNLRTADNQNKPNPKHLDETPCCFPNDERNDSS